MSQGPSTFGSMTTSSLAPAAGTISRMSSRPHGELSALMRVHSPVSPKSVALAMAMKPCRAATLASEGIASSRLPSTTSTWETRSFSTAADLFVVRGHEMDHALELDRQLAVGLGRADGEGSEVLGRGAEGGHGRSGLAAVQQAYSRAGVCRVQ